MPRSKKTEVVVDTDMDKTKMDLENIDPNKKKSKKVKEVVVAKEDKKSKPKQKKINQNQKKINQNRNQKINQLR